MDEQLASNAADAPPMVMFLAAGAHDVKNTMSVIAGTLEGLLDDPTVQQREEFPRLAHMLRQARRVNDTLIQMLGLYREIGTPAYPFHPAPQQAADTIAQVAEAARILLASNKLALDARADAALAWRYDEDLVIGVLGQALSNAVDFARERIAVSAAEVDGWLELRVEDDGPGYAPAVLAANGRPAEQGIDFHTNSTGLGLYFAGEVARMHKRQGRSGGVRIENGGAYGGGCFVLRLP
jgi:two-component system, OmpR family, sensor histidine kinase SenX3